MRVLRERAKAYDCKVCGQNHARSKIQILGKLEAAWIVRVTCTKCQTAFKLLVVIDAGDEARVDPVREERRAQRRPPVTTDEVIDAHEFLRRYTGGVEALVGPAEPARRARSH